MKQATIVGCFALALAGCAGNKEAAPLPKAQFCLPCTVPCTPDQCAQPVKAKAPAPVAVDPCAPGNRHTPQQCPDLDDDGDGIPNKLDKCPLAKGPPENEGCPETDFDMDGVPDRLDKCPAEPGPAENQGCPIPPKPALAEIQGKKIAIKEAIYFDTGKATLQPRSLQVLDDVAAVLKTHPEIQKVVVEGHTDASGKKQANQKLSAARAAAVREYLVRKGVEPARLEAKGYGQTRPIADNKTAAGREKNRRVDFVIAK